MCRLCLIYIISLSFLSAQFIIKDELNLNPAFHQQIEEIGQELYQKSGIGVYIMIFSTTNGESLSTVGQQELNNLPLNSVILTFTEKEKKVDIIANTDILKLFDKEQVLSPLPWKGTILPILGEKIKEDVRNKYSVALFNGYADIVEQIAESNNIVLEHAVGNSNKYVLNTLRVIFYSIILLALGYMIYKKFRKGSENV